MGDSRIYRYRNEKLTQLSHDHSRYVYRQNTVLTRALGMDCHLDIDYQAVPLQQGDLFLLSSDALRPSFIKLLNCSLPDCPQQLIFRAMAN